jgi:hypothetical protein
MMYTKYAQKYYLAEELRGYIQGVLWSFVEELVNSHFIYSLSSAENTCTKLLSEWDTQVTYRPLNRVVYRDSLIDIFHDV